MNFLSFLDAQYRTMLSKKRTMFKVAEKYKIAPHARRSKARERSK
jgi:hypothetical protein